VKKRIEKMWRKALAAYKSARRELNDNPDLAVSQAYYAAFYAVSARFALQDKSFSKHTALEAAVHRDLVKTGLWPVELGRHYSELLEQRWGSDYDFDQESSAKQAAEAIAKARLILRAVQQMHSDVFTDPESLLKDNPKV
jgi:uncharacterized protein (UPF0332 family)